MTDFDIAYEWQRGPATVASHAATWARLTIRFDAVRATRVEDLERSANREGIYGPLMPLAEWIAANWWFLESEPYEGNTFVPARGARASRRSWYSRHNFLYAREGFALPDLTLATVDGETSLVGMARDPGPSGRYQVQFLEDGLAIVPRVKVLAQLRKLVEATVAQLTGVTSADATELRERWTQIERTTGDDRILRQRAAALGLDGDDPESVDDELARGLAYDIPTMPEDLTFDVLSGFVSPPTEIVAQARQVSVARKAMKVTAAPTGLEDLRARVHDVREESGRTGRAAYATGWALASAVRDATLGGDTALCGSALDRATASLLERKEVPGIGRSFVRGVSVVRGGGVTVGIAEGSSQSNARFVAARGLALNLLGGPERAATDAKTWAQSVSRAFAAEFVAPRDAVGAAIDAAVLTSAQVTAISKKLGAPAAAVRHQIENHDLAILE